jgi:hypothetical protein
MSNIIPIEQAHRSKAMIERLKAGTSINRNFADNVGDSFPKLSIKGRVFRIRIDGKETPLIDQQTRQPLQFLDVVMVNASRSLAKNYYQTGYEEGDFNPPDCWSLDSVKPDASIPNPISPSCVTCPMNVFGSRITPSGKAAKACTDARRIAVIMPDHLLKPGQEPFVFLLRVPQASLKNLKAYAQLLDRRGFDTPGCVTRISFEYQDVSFPKLTFAFVDGLNDDEAEQVAGIAESALVQSMLHAPDFDAEVSGAQASQPVTGRAARQVAPIMGEPAEQQEAPRQPPPGRSNPVAAGTIDAAMAQAKEREISAAQAKADEAAKVHAAPASSVIELPTGELFDTATGEFVERTKPAVSMPAVDPDVIVLPDGRFFSKTQNKFVASNIVGAPAAVEEPPKRRPPRKAAGKPAEAGTGGTVSSAEATTPPAEMKAPVEAAAQANHSVDPDDMNGVDDEGDTTEVKAAPRGLKELLDTALPTRKQ